MKVVNVTALSDRLAKAKGNDSIDAIAERAAATGHKIDRATVSRYIAGSGARNPPEKVLQALAAGFNLDVRELRVLAGKPAGELGPWSPPDEAARLNEDQRRALNLLIKSIVREDVGSHERSAATSQAPGSGATVHEGPWPDKEKPPPIPDDVAADTDYDPPRPLHDQRDPREEE